MNYCSTRNKLSENLAIQYRYEKMLEKAQDYFNQNYQELDEQEEIEQRKIGMADYMREKNPEKFDSMDDSQITDWFIEINEKYEKEYKLEPKLSEDGRSFH